MARSRKPRANGSATTAPTAQEPPLAHPDRSGPGLDEQTLFKIAEQRQLFEQADVRIASKTKARKAKINNIPIDRAGAGSESSSDSDEDNDGEIPTLPPGAERALEAVLWTVSLAMLHFTFDVLVQHQYGTEIRWVQICQRAFSAWAVFLLLFYALHSRHPNQTLIPGLPARYQGQLRQFLFFTMSVGSGCYLIYVTNMKGYLATQKRAPPLGCLWIWAVVELELPWATLSLLLATGFLYRGGYNLK